MSGSQSLHNLPSFFRRQSFVTHRPEVIYEDVEDTEYHHEQYGAELSLEANHNHDTSHESEYADHDAPNAPFSREHKSGEQEDEKDSARQLDPHFLILLVYLRQSWRSEALSYPAFREHHEQTTQDGKVAQEKVEIEDQTIAEGLSDDDAHEAEDGVIGVFARDYHRRAGQHGDDIDEEEEVG